MRVCSKKMDTLKSSKFEGYGKFYYLLLLFISGISTVLMRRFCMLQSRVKQRSVTPQPSDDYRQPVKRTRSVRLPYCRLPNLRVITRLIINTYCLYTAIFCFLLLSVFLIA